MAGERLKFDGFTEISAVCSHPNHRGRGHSSSLVGTLMRLILNRGESPFLHVYTVLVGMLRVRSSAPRAKRGGWPETLNFSRDAIAVRCDAFAKLNGFSPPQ